MFKNNEITNMKYTGLTNPLPLISGFLPIYLYYISVTGDLKNISLFSAAFIVITIVLFLCPMILLMFCKLIIIRGKEIVLIYPFRFKVIRYGTEELLSVYSQSNQWQRFYFGETYLYFGHEQRIKFTSLDILNFKGLSKRLAIIDKMNNNQFGIHNF